MSSTDPFVAMWGSIQAQQHRAVRQGKRKSNQAAWAARPKGTGHNEHRPEWRLRKKDRPRCGARTRRGAACIRQALKNGRCPNHGGLSTGPRTPEGRQRCSEAALRMWAKRRAQNASVQAAP
jgi:hypothetical protein